MAGNSIGTIFKITTWGESHGPALGVIIDGCPSNISLSVNDIQKELDRRKPVDPKISTTRKEKDRVEILSGVFKGKTLGTPISVIIFNEDEKNQDYEKIKNSFRPGHADFTYEMKYGIRDYRGGGRSSGRETVSRVIAGAIAGKVLKSLRKTKDLQIYGHTIQIGGVHADSYYTAKNLDRKFIEKNPLRCANKKAFKEMYSLVEKIQKEGDSIGAVVEIIIENPPIGLGEPVFDKLSADLSHAFMSIGAVKGVEFGLGFEVACMKGSENNDLMTVNKKGEIKYLSNNAGGILGGISNGNTIIARLAIKPTPSIAKSQDTITSSGQKTGIQIQGRHDVCLAPRIIVIAEAMAKIVILDHILKTK